MSDDSISFFAILCCAIAFTVALFSWHPSQQVTASATRTPPKIMQTEAAQRPPTASVTQSALAEPKS